jgi:hypothetical protein
MLTVERLSRLADLLDQAVAVVCLEETLDAWVVVAGRDDKHIRLVQDLAVAGGVEFDPVEAGFAVALTVKRDGPWYGVSFGALLDLFVDTAKDFFVSCRAFAEVHC